MLKYIWLTREEYWKPASVREEEAKEAEESGDADESKKDEGGEKKAVEVAIDFEGLNERVVTVMNMRGGYDFYAQTPDGKHFAFRSEALGSDDLWIVDWKGEPPDAGLRGRLRSA